MYRSTCILNHRKRTRFRLLADLWWLRHQHPDVETVAYDDEGNIAVVYRKQYRPGD